MTLRQLRREEAHRRTNNRTEYVSGIRKDDDDFPAFDRLRHDVESNNRGIEDRLWNGRAHSVGAESQLANYLGLALLTNSLTLYLARRRALREHPLPEQLAA